MLENKIVGDGSSFLIVFKSSISSCCLKLSFNLIFLFCDSLMKTNFFAVFVRLSCIMLL